MKTDVYTKTVLTVIAICLMVIAGKGTDFFPKAYAGTDLNLATVPVNEDGTMNVRVVSFSADADMDVNVTNQVHVWRDN